jgi:NADH:ubiquinone oxidoreductase subunit D
MSERKPVFEHPEVPTLFDVQEMELNFGPQHPSTHGVLRLVLKVDGEKILEARPEIGYLHRGTEKLFETETYPMGIPHTDRLDYVAAATNKPMRSVSRSRSFSASRSRAALSSSA